MEPLVALDGIGASLGGQPVLRGIDFRLAPGETVGIAGPNGSGKTTFLRLVATLVPPDRGAGTVLGASLGTTAAYSVRSRLGLIGHDPTLIPELTLEENLVHAARLGAFDRGRIETSLEVVGLSGARSRRVDASSFGMKRRAEVAMVLLRRPTVLLLDEPLSGLDEEATGLVRAAVDTTVESGGAAILVSHERSHLSGCGRTLVLERGALVERP